ncbi:MAG: hypothetical protein WBV11_07630 [Salegentibacter sp.]
MALISQQEFEKLAQTKNEICVSIFIPTERGGKEVLEGKDSTHLKSQWQQTEKELEKKGVSAEKISKMAKPVMDLVNDKDFWRHQSDGLAVFISENFFEKYTLPVKFVAYRYISKEFYVKPLVPAFSGDGRFYILALQLQEVKLYEATKYSVGEVYVEDLTPSRLEERVGFDYEPKTLQHKTIKANSGKTQMHGHNAADREDKNEILRFFRAVDKGLHTILHDENVPLVVYCQDHLFPIYQEANTYNHLFEKVINGNPSDTDMLGAHEKALKTIESYLRKEERDKLDKYNELNKTENTTSMVGDIIPAAYEGKIDTLFLENREEIWGTYDEKNMAVKVDEAQYDSNTSLMNLAAAKVIETGGKVFLIESAFMPEKESKMNALLRYTY